MARGMTFADTVGSAPMRIGWRLMAPSWRTESTPRFNARDRRAGMAKEDLAKSRHPDAAPVALDDGDAQRLFQFTQGLGHRRRADMQEVGGARHAALPRDFQECLQVAEADAAFGHGFDNP